MSKYTRVTCIPPNKDGESVTKVNRVIVTSSYLPTIPDSPELLRKSASNYGITAMGKIITEIVDYGNLVTSGNNW